MNESKAYVEKLVREKDDSIRARMEEFVGNWDEDRLMGVLIELQGTTDDIAILARAGRLQRLIGNGTNRRGNSSNDRKLEPEVENMEDIKAEMEAMEQELDAEDAKPTPQPTNTENPVESGKGWSMWEGPWIPKPIGVV